MAKAKRTAEQIALDEKLFSRCREGKVNEGIDPEIIELVKSGADVNYVYFNGMTPLICVIERKSIELTKYLLENKADANYIGAISPHMDPYTPLVKAMEVGSGEIVKLLIDFGADRNRICPISQVSAMAHGWNVFEGAAVFEVLLGYEPEPSADIVGDHEVSNT